MKRVTLILTGLICLPMVGSSSVWGAGDGVGASRATGLTIDWYSIDGGGEMTMTGGTLELSGTLGQADAGPGAPGMTGGTLSLSGGFWVVAGGPCSGRCGDLDGSGGNITLVDFASFALCFDKSLTANPQCACSDMDGNGSINLVDFATFSLVFGKTSPSAPPNCP